MVDGPLGQRDRRPAELVVASGSLVWRFRRAHGIERQQLRWLALAALSALVLLVAMVAPGAVSQAAFGVRVALLPLATGAPILRYGLYDLDRIISRTLAYGLLTLVPAAATLPWSWGSASCSAKTPAWS